MKLQRSGWLVVALLVVGACKLNAQTSYPLPSSLCNESRGDIWCSQINNVVIGGDTYDIYIFAPAQDANGNFTNGSITFRKFLPSYWQDTVESLSGTVTGSSKTTQEFTGTFSGSYTGSISFRIVFHSVCSRYCHVYWIEDEGTVTLQ